MKDLFAMKYKFGFIYEAEVQQRRDGSIISCQLLIIAVILSFVSLY